MKRFAVTCAAFVFLAGFASPAFARRDTSLPVRILDASGKELRTFSFPISDSVGGASVAVGDLGSDGTPEIVVGSGIGSDPRVYVLRKDGTKIGDFLAYASTFGFGVNVAVCDLDGDGTREIVTAPQRGGTSHLRVFSNFGKLIAETRVPDGESTAGTNLACGNIGYKNDTLFTLPAAGEAPTVRSWHLVGKTISLDTTFDAGPSGDRRGRVGAVANGTLLVAAQRASDGTVETYARQGDRWQRTDSSRVQAQNAGLTGILPLSSGTRLVGFAGGASPLAADSTSSLLSGNAAVGDLEGDGSTEIVSVPSKPLFDETLAGDAKAIAVDLSDQRLYAYENGILTNTFLVSTAKAPFKTPLGRHLISDNPLYVHYAGGAGKDAYDLGIVKYNLRFAPHIYIHYAPWHDKFGTPVSHGCVNVRLDRMQWIYGWAPVGTPVVVRE